MFGYCVYLYKNDYLKTINEYLSQNRQISYIINFLSENPIILVLVLSLLVISVLLLIRSNRLKIRESKLLADKAIKEIEKQLRDEEQGILIILDQFIDDFCKINKLDKNKFNSDVLPEFEESLRSKDSLLVEKKFIIDGIHKRFILLKF
jgi:hypothetical protein